MKNQRKRAHFQNYSNKENNTKKKMKNKAINTFLNNIKGNSF